MSLCRNNIISNSSFSWWGAWLNANPAKRVLSPGMWFGYNLSHDWRDIYFRGMEVVPNSYTPGLRLRAALSAARESFGQFVWRVLRAFHLQLR